MPEIAPSLPDRCMKEECYIFISTAKQCALELVDMEICNPNPSTYSSGDWLPIYKRDGKACKRQRQRLKKTQHVLYFCKTGVLRIVNMILRGDAKSAES